MKRQNNFTAFHFAKRLQGLSHPEKQAITAIADACGTLGGVCTKSVATLAEEKGVSERAIQYGIHGRHEGKSPIAGLVSRGLVYADGNLNGGGFYWDEKKAKRKGLTIRWKIDARALMSYLSEDDATAVWQFLHPEQSQGEHEGEHSEQVRVNIPDSQGEHFQSQGEHFGGSGCTNAHKYPNAVPQSNTPQPSPKEKTGGGKDFSKTSGQTKDWVEETQKMYRQQLHRKLPNDVLQDIFADRKHYAVYRAVEQWLLNRDFTGLKQPELFLAAELNYNPNIVSQEEIDRMLEAHRIASEKRMEDWNAQQAADNAALAELQANPNVF